MNLLNDLRVLPFRFRRKLCHWRGDARGVAKWSNRIAHAATLPPLIETFDDSVHPDISLEITTACNYRCPFCPQSSVQRESGEMSMDDLNHVVEGLSRIGFEKNLVLSVNNEPFAHPQILAFCELISRRLPGATCSLISNGSLITRDQLAFLAALPVPPHLLIDDYTPDHGIIVRLKEWMKDLPGGSRVTVAYLERSMTERLSNRAGHVPDASSAVEDYRNVVCTWPFIGVFVRFDLQAFLCCSDFRHEVIMGNLREQSVMEIWQGARYRDVRRKMLATQRADLPLCCRCDAEWFGLPQHCRVQRRARRHLATP